MLAKFAGGPLDGQEKDFGPLTAPPLDYLHVQENGLVVRYVIQHWKGTVAHYYIPRS